MALALKQEDKKELSQSVKYINIVHGNSEGWITKAKISAGGYKQWHYKHMQLVELKFDEDNVYITLNTFYKTYRRIEYLRELNALFIDLDTYKTGFTKEQILMNLNEIYFGKNIPIPNLIIDSGRGLYLIGVASGKCGFHTLRAFSQLIPMVCRLFRYSKVYIVL